MTCPKCGVEVADDASSCSACGEPILNAAVQEETAPPPRILIQRFTYAGFWLRALAYVIDILLLSIVAGSLILKPMMDHAGIPLDNSWAFFTDVSRQIIAIKLAILMAGWLYWGLMESSVWQATIGKRMVGLRVTDLKGGRLTLARASARYFAKLISQFLLFLGFVMAGFTEKKQALHDMLAGCLVLKKT